MAKKKAEKASADKQPPTKGAAGEPKPRVSKMGMVREALRELGTDAKPADIGGYVRAKFGADLPPQIISAYKSVINSRPRGGYGMGGGSSAGAVAVADVEAVRGLIARVGAQELGHLVRVLAR